MADPYNPTGDYYSGYGAAPAYGTQPPPRPASMFGFNPSAPSGPLEGAAQSVLPLIAEMLRNQFGGSAFTFGSDMNVTSARLAQQFLQQMNSARTFGAGQDERQLTQTMSGIARMLGHNMNDPEVNRAVGVLSGNLSGMLPLLAAAFPDSIDKWMQRGSMTVASASFVNAGRFVIDPMTGLPTSQNAQFGSQVLGPLLDAGERATYGLGAGRLGQTYEQLVSRGLIGGGGDLRDRVTSGELTGEGAREIQSDRIRKQLGTYSRAISAINDIFAEAGRPNTPIGELFAGLQKLTQGGLGTMNPDDLAQSVRTSQAAAQMTGMGIEAQGALAAQFGQGLRAGGRTTALAPYLSTYTAFLGRTYADRGLIFGGPEGQTMEDMIAGTGAVATAGATSDYSRQVGAVLALGNSAAPGTAMRALADGIRNRQSTVALPDGTSVDVRSLTPEAINAIAAGSGMGAGAYQQQMLATGQINGALGRDPVAAMRAVRDMQQFQARQYFLQQTAYGPLAGMSDVDRNGLYDRLLEASADGSNLDDDAVVRATGLTGEAATFMRTSILGGRFGGRHRLNEVNPVISRRNDAMYDLGVARGMNADQMAGVMRGGWQRNITRAIIGGGSLQDMFMKAMGLVSDDDFNDPIRNMGLGQTLEYMSGIYGIKPSGEQLAMRAVGAGARFTSDFGSSEARAAARASLIDAATDIGRGLKGGGGWGGAGDVGGEGQDTIMGAAGAIGRGAGKRGAPVASNVSIQISNAQVVFKDGGVSISGGGAMHGVT